MLRKYSVALIISLLSNSCFSDSYIGAAVGPEGAMFTRTGHIFGTFNSASVDAINKNHFAGFGGFGSIFAGYGFKLKQFYLAGELNANLSSVKYDFIDAERFSGDVEKRSYTVKYSESFSILPGLFLSPKTLFYARLGVVNARIDINQENIIVPDAHTNRLGFRYGLGMRHHFSPRWAMMLEYSQINYQSINNTASIPVSGLTLKTSMTPYTGQAAFGLLYYFDGCTGL